MTRVLSGIQPSGDLHLGNYFGAVRNWVAEQDRSDAFYCIVDLHALTLAIEPETLRHQTLDAACVLLASGLDPERCTLFVQSHVAAHQKLTWLLECTATMGELRRMTQFKDKGGGQESVSVGLFTYPVLMAADILLYEADEVPADGIADLVGVTEERVVEVLRRSQADLVEQVRGFVLVELASGWRLQSNPAAADMVQRFASRDLSARLSTAALETLAIVAYRQPVSRAQMAALRGVNVDGVTRLLEQRGYIEAVGRADGPGQPILYGTTEVFLDRLGLSSLEQLPRPENLLPDADEANQLAEDLLGSSSL